MSQQVYDETQVRRVQTPDEYSFTFCFPKTFARALGIHIMLCILLSILIEAFLRSLGL